MKHTTHSVLGRSGAVDILFCAFLAVIVLGGIEKAEAKSPASDRSGLSLWEYEQRAFPGDRIPPGARLRAWEQIRQWNRKHRFLRASTASTPDLWVSIGPGPLELTDCTGCGLAGRTTCLATDPSDTNHWYVGAAQGGVWETRDAGTSWQPLTDNQASLAMGALALAPGNPRVVYAGTGEPNNSVDSYAGAGLLKSTDGGATWQLLGTNVFAGDSFSAIIVDPQNSDALVAATKDGVAGRAHTFVPGAPPMGLFKSADGGIGWVQTLAGAATSLINSPEDFSRQYAGLGYRKDSSSNGVYRSVDAGVTWTRLLAATIVPGRVQLAIAPSNPNIVYASTARMDSLAGVWMTTNAWATTPTWTRLPTLTNSYAQWSYDQAITVDPTDPRRIYLGGERLWTFDGTNWTEITDSWRWTDLHAFAWAGTRLIVGDDGRVYSTPDGGETWINNTSNLRLAQFYAGAVSPSSPDFALGGCQDLGIPAWTDSSAWNEVWIGDGLGVAISAAHPDTDWAISIGNLTIRRTTDGGNTFTLANSGINTSYRPWGGIAMSPADSDVLIAGTDRLWKCTNFFSGQVPTWFGNSASVGSQVTAFAFAPSDASSATYAFGTADGRVFVTADSGATWTPAQNALPGRWITSLAFNPTNAEILYAAFSGFDPSTPANPGHIFKTSDAFAPSPVWQNISPPADLPCNVITLDPLHPSTVFVGTDIGIWKSTDAGNTWVHDGPETGMPNVAVFDLKANTAGRVVAFTHGRGAFALVPRNLLRLTITDSTTNETLSWPSILPDAVLQYRETLGSNGRWTDYPFAPEQRGDLDETVLGRDSGQWIGVGENGTILASRNGSTWTTRDTGSDAYLNGVADGDGRWVAVGEDGVILSSPDGVTWSSQNSGTTNELDAIGYGGGLWVAVGGSGTILTSSDGVQWTGRYADTNLWLFSVGYGGGEWAAADLFGATLTSKDGITWTPQNAGTANLISSLRFANGLWVAVGSAIMTSTDARTWTVREAGTSTIWNNVAYGNGQWIAVGDDGSILSSPDGVTWARQSSPTANWLQAISYGQGIWLAVGSDGAYTSTDGQTWTLQTSDASVASLSGIHYGAFTAAAASDFFRLVLR